MEAVWRLVCFVELLIKVMESVLAATLVLGWRKEESASILEN
jgi:hypothetical protein